MMRFAVLTLVAVSLSPCAGAQQQTPPGQTNPSALKRLSLEQLAQIDVTSVGKKEEKLSHAAAAIYVITQDQIRRAGVRSIPEALRLAPGIEVARFNNGSWEISARGFDTTSANKIQVFMDGRSVYTPLFGGVFWDVQNTLIEDIDRIEVIRGPGATLWGGNAVNAVINIITKSARDTQGELAVAGGGAGERGFAGFRHGGTVGDRVSYRAYGQYFNRDSLASSNGSDAKDPFQLGEGGFRAEAQITDSDLLNVQGDVYRGLNGILNRSDISLHGGDLMARWDHRFANGSDFQVQTYYDRTSRFVPLQFDEIRNTYDVDIQHHFHHGPHDVVWGTGYRVSDNATKQSSVLFFEPSGRHLGLFNIFGQDEISLTDKLHFIAGSKFENNTYTGWEVQPTGRLAWFPSDRQTVWGAVSRAVRIPTEFDEDLRIALPGTSTVLIRGDTHFQSEALLAYEVGYRVMPTPKVSLDIATYYNDYDHLRSQEVPRTVFPVVLANNLRGHTYGAELVAQYQLLPWWRVVATYSNLQKRLHLIAGSTDLTQGRQEGSDPRNQFSFRSYMDGPHRTEMDFWVRDVSALQLFNAPTVPAYLVFDVRAGWRPSEDVEVSVVGRNLPDQRHAEFGPLGELVRRTVYATVTWRF